MDSIKRILISLTISIGLLGCSENWDEHYNNSPETVNMNVWEAMQSESAITEFVQIIKDFKYDTLFDKRSTYTIFIPTNEAISAYKAENEIDEMLLNYLITPNFIQSRGIKDKRKIQTLGSKFALFENDNGIVKFDGVVLSKESPLYLNGKYFIMNEVAPVKPNIYEYYAINNPVLKKYIDSQDSIIIDKERSIAKGFDQDGNTIFDTVSIIYNKFEELYFPVRHEFRHQTVTMVFPKEDLYNEALNKMALNLNLPGFNSYKDIPLDWQNRVLLPELLKKGVFENMLEPEEFQWLPGFEMGKMKNILGDSVIFNYIPMDKNICSNGYVYDYTSFEIHDSMYMNPYIFEAEWLLKDIGSDKYAWHEWVNVQSATGFAPLKIKNANASNDSLISVVFPSKYNGSFSVEFSTASIFPQKYLMVVSTNMNYGGIFDIYVNDVLMRRFDYYDFIRYRQYNMSVTGERYAPRGNLGRFDMWVENLKEYGPAKVRFEYIEPGNITDNGFIIDYISFIPYNK